MALVQSNSDPDFESYLSRYAEVKLFSYDEMERASQYPCVIVNVRKEDIPPPIPSHAVLALFDSPYSLYSLTYSQALVGYEDEKEVKEAISDVLFGQLRPLGKLPIPLCTKERSDHGRRNSE